MFHLVWGKRRVFGWVFAAGFAAGAKVCGVYVEGLHNKKNF